MSRPSNTPAVDFDVLIIGGGIIGMAIARQLSSQYSVLLAEQHDQFGTETSSRNSEVIHAGLYYPEGSLKEQLCLAGKQALYEFCDRYDVPCHRTGKLIVSSSCDHPKLRQLEVNAERLSIPVERLDQSELAETEPKVQGEEALFSPTTGVIDSHSYLQRLEQQASTNGALIMAQTRYISAVDSGSSWSVELNTPDGATKIQTRCVINAAGLNSSRIAADFGVSLKDYSVNPCIGRYFSYSGKSPFRHLVYPLPEQNLAGLGIHATIDLGGGLRFGPDARYLDHCSLSSEHYDYSVDEALRATFVAAIRRYFPTLDENRLHPDYSGMRPKLHHRTDPARDFEIVPGSDEFPASIHLLGIESPGLTASLAIAEEVENRLFTHFT